MNGLPFLEVGEITGCVTNSDLFALEDPRAVGVCRNCPHWQACRTWSLDNPKDAEAGIWGGLTEKDRQRLRRAA